MYILSFDLGSTNYKVVVMKMENDDISLIGKKLCKASNFENIFEDIVNSFEIPIEKIEIIIATGVGASFLNDEYKNIKVLKVSEFIATSYGGLLLSNNDNGLIVSIGTGTSIVYSDMKNVERIGGTGLGGGTIFGLANKFINDEKIKSHFEIIEMAKKGDSKNVDLTVGDVNKGNIDNLTKDITASNFAGVNKIYNTNDVIAGIINMVFENIILLVEAFVKEMKLKYNFDNLKVVFIGTIMSDEYIKNLVVYMCKFLNIDACIVDLPEYIVAIGAYEYYLLRVRENI